MLKKRGFTLVEIIVVVIIVGILAAFGMTQYVPIKERSLNRAVKPILSLIRAAEKDYKMDHGTFYPSSGTENNLVNINTNLKLSLPVSASIDWTISLDCTTTGFANATRSGTGADGRVWKIDFPGDANPSCTGGTYCNT